ncbi:hypothetical protein [Thermococcus sp. JdF3]|nr:hypothetical protein [Thermococcus sp. JdF3]
MAIPEVASATGTLASNHRFLRAEYTGRAAAGISRGMKYPLLFIPP